MNTTAQTLVLAAIAGVSLRIGVTNEYANYVNEWMRWPLIVSGVLLIALAVVATVRGIADAEHPTGPVAWLLVLPVVVGFVVQPPALGAYVADRRVNQVDQSRFDEPARIGLDKTGEHAVRVADFVAQAAYDDGALLQDVTVRLTGFVSSDDDGWYVTRLSIACCAADAAAFRVRVEGVDAPPVEQWVEVVGTLVEGSGTEVGDTPVLAAEDLSYIDQPKRPYE